MGLRETTRSIIALVEEVSAFPVLVSEDPNLQTLAVVRMARGGASAHYLIAYQCGFILRHFAPPKINALTLHRPKPAVKS